MHQYFIRPRSNASPSLFKFSLFPGHLLFLTLLNIFFLLMSLKHYKLLFYTCIHPTQPFINILHLWAFHQHFAQLRVRNSQLDGKGELTSRRGWFPRNPTAPLQNTAGLSIPWPKEAFSASMGEEHGIWQPLCPCERDQLPGMQTNHTWAPGWPPLVKFTGPPDVFSSQLPELEKDNYKCPHFIEMKKIPERSCGSHQ